MGKYDRAERAMLHRLDPQGVLRWLLHGLDPDLVPRRWLESQLTSLENEEEGRVDGVCEFVSQSGTQPPWACLVELQGQVRAYFLTRVLRYLLDLFDELRVESGSDDRYLMMAGIINLSETALPEEWNHRPPGNTDGKGFGCNFWVKNVRFEQAAATLADIATGQTAACILVWVPMMIGGEEPGTIEEWKRQALGLEDRPTRASYVALALTFAEMAGRLEIWKVALEGWDVEESPLWAEWNEKARKRGEEVGELRGEERTLRQMAARQQIALIRSLETRFNCSLPADLRQTIESQGSVERLLVWFELAVERDSLAAFQTALREQPTS
jgi:hypothetical protein